MSGFLQVFLICNVFMIGVLCVLAVQHGLAHFRPRRQPDKPRPARQDGHLPPEVRQRLSEAAQVHYQAVLDRSAAQLQHDLAATGDQLNKTVGKIASHVVSTEMERYQAQLEQLRAAAAEAIGSAQDEVRQHQADLEARLAEQRTVLEARMQQEIAAEKARLQQELAAEKAALAAQLDGKLADAVASFLLETLGHNIDLGAQSAYLTAMLDEHKDELKRGVAG